MGLTRSALRLILLFLVLVSSAAADPWLTPKGPGDLRWGTDEQPLDATPRRMDYFLPDSRYVGRDMADKPVDLQVPGPRGVLWIVRYMKGLLRSAWMMQESPIDTSLFAAAGALEWKGPVLGPADGRWRAIGDAISWRVGPRTAMYWQDRVTKRTILSSRTPSSGSYAVRRAKVLKPGYASATSARITGTMRKYLKDSKKEISGCLEYIVKPIGAKVHVGFDDQGRLARIRADTDQSAPNIVECLAGALIDVSAPPNHVGSFELYRFH